MFRVLTRRHTVGLPAVGEGTAGGPHLRNPLLEGNPCVISESGVWFNDKAQWSEIT